MANFPSPPLDQIPLAPGQFLMVDGFEIPSLVNIIRSSPRVRMGMSYVDGFGGWNALFATPLPPWASKAAITIHGNRAHIGDDEQFALSDATLEQWLRDGNAVPIGGKPCAYKSAGSMDSLARLNVWKWAAHYGFRGGGRAASHVCGPATCGLVNFPCGATQCYDVGPNGENVDISIAQPGFMGVGAPVQITIPEDEAMITSNTDPDGTLHVFVFIPHDDTHPTKGGKIFELYHTGGGWAGGAQGKQKAEAFFLADIPANVA